MKCASHIAVWAALGIASAAHAQDNAETETPNIIVYLADDIGVEAFGSYGGTSYETPNLDRLAAGGIRFTRAYSMPLCTPTRVAFLTGKYNFRNYDNFGYLHTAERTIANYLQAAGYATAFSGKWQLGGSFQTPHLFGFDEYLVWQLEEGDWWNRYKNPILTRNGESTRSREGAYGPDLFAEFAMDFMERHRDRPFFLVFMDTLPHDRGFGTPFRLVHDGRYKLYPDGRFFDFIADPREEHPLPENERSPDARRAHEALTEVITRMEAEVRLWDSRRDESPQQLATPPPRERAGRRPVSRTPVCRTSAKRVLRSWW